MNKELLKKNKGLREKEDERQLKRLIPLLREKGFNVRRENLPRGHAFHARSGSCVFSGKDFIFIDKRLPVSNQLSLLVDYALERKVYLSAEELKGCLSVRTYFATA